MLFKTNQQREFDKKLSKMMSDKHEQRVEKDERISELKLRISKLENSNAILSAAVESKEAKASQTVVDENKELKQRIKHMEEMNKLQIELETTKVIEDDAVSKKLLERLEQRTGAELADQYRLGFAEGQARTLESIYGVGTPSPIGEEAIRESMRSRENVRIVEKVVEVPAEKPKKTKGKK